MKVEKISKEKTFKPIVLQVTFESREEVKDFKELIIESGLNKEESEVLVLMCDAL